MKKTLLITLLLVPFFGGLEAKTKLQLEGGVNLSHYKWKQNGAFDGYQQKHAISAGARLGVTASFQLSEALALEPGLFYVYQGFTWSATEEYRLFLGTWGQPYYTGPKTYFPPFDYKITVHTIEVPVYFTLRTLQKSKSYCSLGIGPFLGYNLFGKEKNGIYDAEPTPLDIGKPGGLSRTYGGAGLKIGYHFKSRLAVNGYYQYNLTNELSSQGGNEGQKLRHYNFGVTIGYQLSRKN